MSKVMTDNRLVVRSKAFAVDIISFCENLGERKRTGAIRDRILRGGTGIGANVHEANFAV